MALKPIVAASARSAQQSPDGDERLDDVPPGGWPTPRSLYLHVPFCRHRCGYCNFSVIANRDDLIDRFVQAIDVELAQLAEPVVETIFLGGGTPTHLPHDRLARLLDSICRRVRFADNLEWAVEANPEDICAETVAVISEAGINRVSLGVQSFRPDKLSVLERGHQPATAIRAIETVAARIPNLSIDLIFAAPGESISGWRADLTTALRLPIRHLSTYALTYEKGTRYWSRRRRGDLQSLSEADEVEMYHLARELTAAAGLAQYEVSNFAYPGSECRHNIAYWQGRGWLAVGPGAASFQNGFRNVNHRSTTSYLKRIESGASPVAESESISVSQYARERAAFGIRMNAGIDLNQLTRETGMDCHALFSDSLRQAAEQGLLIDLNEKIRLTERGILFADSVAGSLLG